MSSDHYYTGALSAERLKKCYDIAPPRTIEYLEAELQHATSHISLNDKVLELGCGYGRALFKMAEKARSACGIDTSLESLVMAKKLNQQKNIHLFQMNASSLGFSDNIFDIVVCVQNGISAFKLNPEDLLRESIRVTRKGGKCLFSSYSEKFWDSRLEWFQLQAAEGLLGEIDWNHTRDGVIVCKDGFKATTFGADDFLEITDRIGVEAVISEIDRSSIFCEIIVDE
ncbi:MAG: class I SAM-dependent methyltransferase [Candidatus Thorarchaeota archaeon]